MRKKKAAGNSQFDTCYCILNGFSNSEKGILQSSTLHCSLFLYTCVFFSSFVIVALAVGQFPRVNFNYAHSKRNEIKSGACKVFDRRQRSENCCGIIESVAAYAAAEAAAKSQAQIGFFLHWHLGA